MKIPKSYRYYRLADLKAIFEIEPQSVTDLLAPILEAPIMCVFEAKDDNIEHWYGQCGAEMLAEKYIMCISKKFP